MPEISARWLPEDFWEIVDENPEAPFEENYAKYMALTSKDTPSK